jgi:hypothetical protein
MRTTVVVAAFVFGISLGLAVADGAEAALHAKPIQIKSCDILPGQVMPIAGFMQHQAGFEIVYLVEGADLVGVKSATLAIDSILTPDGRNIAKKRNGNRAYSLGSFPKATDDGKYCIFSLQVDDASQFGKVEQLKIKGSIAALVGSAREEKTLELSVNDTKPAAEKKGAGDKREANDKKTAGDKKTPKAKKTAADKKVATVGPFTIAIGDRESGGFGGLFGPLLGGMGTAPQPAAAPQNGKPSFVGIKLTGPMEAIIDVKFKDGDQELQSGYEYDTNSRQYTFSKPSSGKLTLMLSYWADLKETKVLIGQ